MWDKIISAGANLAAGLIGKSATEKANAANIAHQKQFAKQGIQWKVADAEKAGVHPLFALGASTHSFAPSSVGDSSLPSAMANMGQDLGRAAQAAMSHGEKQATGAFTVAMQKLQLERGALENTLLASKIARENQVGSAPALAMPTDRHFIESQGDVPLFSADPKVANITPPSPDVETTKFFGMPLLRNPRLFSSGQTGQNEFGELAENIIGVPAMIEAYSRALLQSNISAFKRAKSWRK